MANSMYRLTPTAGGISLIKLAKSFNAQLKSVVAGSGIVITDNGAGLLTIASGTGSGLITSVGPGFLVNSGQLNSAYTPPRTVTGATDAITTADGGSGVRYNNAAAVAVSLPAASSAGFTQGFAFPVWNFNVGAVTITPASGTINGASTLVLQLGQAGYIYSDGTNYQLDYTTSTNTTYFNPITSAGVYDISSIRLGNGTYSNNTSILYTANPGNNVGIGNNALGKITSGTANLCIGAGAGGSITTTSTNVAIGYNALASGNTGVQFAIGYQALRQSNNNGNFAIGNNAGGSITSGQDNLVIGNSAANANATSGNTNLLIGHGVDVTQAGNSLEFNIGNILRAKRQAPGVATGFGTGPTVQGSSGTLAFTVTVGSAPTTTGTISFGIIAPNAWAVYIQNTTSGATLRCIAKPNTTNPTFQVDVTSYAIGTSTATAFNAGDVLTCIAIPY